MEKSTMAKIESKELAWGDRLTVMDNTRDRIYNKSYELLSVSGSVMKNVISVTLPYAAIFVNAVVSDLMDSTQALVVEGDLPKRTAKEVEDFLNHLDEQIDEQLLMSQGYTLDEWLASHVCVRSFIGMQYASQNLNGEFQLKALPVDMRWTFFERDTSGLVWVAPRFFWDEDMVNHEFEQDIKAHGLPWFKGPQIEVNDYWDREKNEVLVNKVRVRLQKNQLGEVPFIISQPATGFILRDADYLKHESEDLLFLIRDLYDEMNRLASVQQTKAMETIDPGYLNKKEQVDQNPAQPPPKNGQTVQSKINEGYELVPKPDLNQAFLTAKAELEKVASDGSYTSVDLGNVNQQVSSLWITAQSSIRKKFSGQRLKALANFKGQKARMALRQYARFSGQTEGFKIGSYGKKRIFSPAKVGDPETYSCKYELRSHDPLLEIANLNQFLTGYGKLPLRYNLTNVLKASDPEGIIREIEIEQARAQNPSISLMERAISLVEEAEGEADEVRANALLLQSRMLTRDCVAMLSNPQPAAPAAPGAQGAPKGTDNMGAALGRTLASWSGG